MSAYRSLLKLTLMLLVIGVSSTSVKAAQPNSRWAFLVGIDQYAQLRDLEFAAADQRALAALLPTVGFPADQIVLLNDEAKRNKYQPTRLNLLRELDLFLKLVSPGDVVIVGFSGHGVSVSGKSYFCPADANPDEPKETMIAVEDVFAKLSASPAKFKLLVVDACRNDPQQPGQRNLKRMRESNEFNQTLSRPPDGLLVISSCGHDQMAWEDKEVGHGVFMHFMLDGLKGKAADDDGAVRLMRLYDYASIETKKYVQRKFSAHQSPAFEGKADGPFELARLERVGKTETPPPSPPPAASTPLVKPPETIVNSVGMKLIRVPAGEFMMGGEQSLESLIEESQDPSATRDANARVAKMLSDLLSPSYPQHRVRISRPFYLGIHEVTRAQFRAFVEDVNYTTDCEHSDADGKPTGGMGMVAATPFTLDRRSDFNWRNVGFVQSDDSPVVNVSRDDAVAFCKWLGLKEKRKYRLPTEAEWEYACRAGSKTHYSFGDDVERLVRFGNVADATLSEVSKEASGLTGRDEFAYLAPIGRFQPNEFGLYDMHGNVREWCSDVGDATYYRDSPVNDPKGPSSGELGLIRGSSFYDLPLNCFSAFRWLENPAKVGVTLGFRIVCEP